MNGVAMKNTENELSEIVKYPDMSSPFRSIIV